jgi:hypothetical protein
VTTDLLERAHAAAYRFPAGFAGFTASVHTSAGDAGTVVVRGRRDHEFTFTHTAGDADWAREQVASILGHRWPAPYAEGDGRYSHHTETDGDPGGMLVRLTGDPMNSAYRVRDDEISEVHRTTGQVRFSIVISGSTHTAEGRLPDHFSVYYWRPGDGRLIKADQYRDTYTEVAGVWLPTRRVITTADDDGLTTRALDLRDHRLVTA